MAVIEKKLFKRGADWLVAAFGGEDPELTRLRVEADAAEVALAAHVNAGGMMRGPVYDAWKKATRSYTDAVGARYAW